MKQYNASLFQNGLQVAGVSGPNKESVQREIAHYALLYGQDGPVEIKANFNVKEEEDEQIRQ